MDKFEKVVKYIEENNINIYGLKINENNEINEKIFIDERVNIYSIGKSITALCIFILVDRKVISLEDKMVTFFPEFSYSDNTEKITIQNLLDMQSGKNISFVDSPFIAEVDYLAKFFDYPVDIKIGEFSYSNSCSYTLGRIVTKVTGQILLEFAYNNIFKELGISSPRWVTCGMGYTICANHIWLNIDELFRITELLRNNGSYNGKQIISNSHFEKFKREFNTLENNLEYLNSFWNIDIYDGYFMKGIYSNVGMVIPKINTSIAITACEKDNKKRDELIDYIKKVYTN